MFSILTYRVLLKRRIFEKKYLNYCLLGILPLYASLFVFHNTGWASDFFWNNGCISCMSSRHIFPIYFFTIMILGLFVKTRFLLVALLQIIFLNIVYLLSNQIFQLILQGDKYTLFEVFTHPKNSESNLFLKRTLMNYGPQCIMHK